MFDLNKFVGVKSYSFRTIKDNVECAKAIRYCESTVVDLSAAHVNYEDPESWAKVPNADPWEARQHQIRQTMRETSEKFFDISPERITLSPDGLLFWNSIAESLI